MDNTFRNQRQEEWAQAWLDSSRKSILYLCPRAGKCRTTIKIMDALGVKKGLICYPRIDVKESWISDFKELGFDSSRIEFVTKNSLKKKVIENYDFFCIDEIHEMSINQLEVASVLVDKVPTLALTGTMTDKTQKEILITTGLYPCYIYNIAQGVEEGILCDYTINVHKVSLDNIHKTYSNGKRTEKKQFDSYEYVKNNSNRFMIELKQISLLQNSIAKLKKTRELIEVNKNGRLLVFAGTTEIADKMEIPVYHSKTKDKSVFLDFCQGRNYKHMACCKMLNAGVTIKPISRLILNYTSGSSEEFAQRACRALGFEYDNPNKKAIIDLVTSDEQFELVRIKTALNMFDQNKIVYV